MRFNTVTPSAFGSQGTGLHAFSAIACLLLLFALRSVAAHAAPLTQTGEAPCPAPDTIITEYNIPTPNSEPFGITAGTDGAIWFGEGAGKYIGRVNPDGTITEFPHEVAHHAQYFFAPGPDGAIWFNDDFQNRIGRITSKGAITSYPIPTGKEDTDDEGAAYITSLPRGLVEGTDGAMWFTEALGNNIGRITMDGEVTEYPLPTPDSLPVGIARGSDGAVWFVERGANQIGRITMDGEITEYPIPTPESAPLRIAAGTDGALWFTEFAGNRIGRITTTGVFTEYPLPTPDAGPVGLTALGNAVFFTEFNGNNIGCITLDGQISEYPIPTPDSVPFSITAGLDGAVWFTENATSKIGRLQAQAVPPGTAQSTFLTEQFALPMSLRFSSEWHVLEEFADLVTLKRNQEGWELGFNLVTNARVADPASGERIPFPEDFAAWIQANPDFESDPPIEVTLGGIRGVQIDVTPVPATKKDFLFLGATGWNMLPAGERWRFILLDNVKGERLLVMLLASAEQFDVATQNAQAVLDGLVFME
jgi:virginiamycin B lyase